MIIGATSAPALAAAARSDPNLQGRFSVFHCACSVLPEDVLDCKIGTFAGIDTDRERLLSSTGGGLCIGSSSVALQPASRVMGTAMAYVQVHETGGYGDVSVRGEGVV